MSVYIIHASRCLRIYIAALHSLACLAVALAEMAWPWRLAACLGIMVSAYLSWPRARESRLRHGEKGHLAIWRDAAWREVEVRPESVVLPALTVLRMRELDGGGRHELVILKDNLPVEDYRHLRVWLRHKVETVI